MKLNLSKKKLKSLTADNNILPNQVTPNIAGGTFTQIQQLCSPTAENICNNTDAFRGCPTGAGCYSSPQYACIDPQK